jgi:molecular chaperone GrpE
VKDAGKETKEAAKSKEDKVSIDETRQLTAEELKKIRELFNEQEDEILKLKEDAKKYEEQVKKFEAQTKDLTHELEERKKEIHHYEKEMKMVRVEYTKQVHENEDTVRRYRKMIEEEKVFAITKFAKDLLEVRDALRFALEDRDMEAIASEKSLEDLRSFLKSTVEGLQLTAESMDHCLARFNIKMYDPKGEKFDPTLHECVFTVKESDAEENTVAVCMQTGFKIGDRVLRAAKVGIVKH